MQLTDDIQVTTTGGKNVMTPVGNVIGSLRAAHPRPLPAGHQACGVQLISGGGQWP